MVTAVKDNPRSGKQAIEMAVTEDDYSTHPPLDEWSGLEPTEKEMGLVQLTLDKGVKTTVVGTVYGLDFEIEDDEYTVNVFFDYYNKRLKILDYEAKSYTAMIHRLAYLAEANSFDKIFVKAFKEDFQKWLSHGYMMEGVLRYYFKGEDAFILSRFSSQSRLTSESILNEAQMIEDLIYNSQGITKIPDSTLDLVEANDSHIPMLVAIYRSVFETYPSPLTNPDYIKSTMDRDVIYRIAIDEEGIAVAAASAEINYKFSNAEVTDCATIPRVQGKGAMQQLINALEGDLQKKKIQTAYSLARSQSMGMNRVFFLRGYEFSGRLINNCDIFGQFEDMNIWVKPLF